MTCWSVFALSVSICTLKGGMLRSLRHSKESPGRAGRLRDGAVILSPAEVLPSRLLEQSPATADSVAH